MNGLTVPAVYHFKVILTLVNDLWHDSMDGVEAESGYVAWLQAKVDELVSGAAELKRALDSVCQRRESEIGG